MKKITLITVVAIISFALSAPLTLAQEEVVCESDAVVQVGDWLSKLADKYYGDILAYPLIVTATNARAISDNSYATIDNVDLIEPGWKLCIPPTTKEIIMEDQNSSTASPDAETASYLNEVDTHVALFQAVEPIPLLTPTYSEFALADALAFQENYVIALAGKSLGYKLGLTGATRPFGAPEAVWGRLLEAMVVPEGEIINLSDFVSPRIEVEIAFIFGTDVAYPTNEEALRNSVAEVAPAIELPDIFFADMPNLSWLDLVAHNVGARHLIIGQRQPVGDLDLDATQTIATHNGVIINEAPGSASMGGQWLALQFLVKKLNEQGLELKKGDVVITGALGPLLPAEPGLYEVSYGDLGQIQFEIK